MIIFSVVIMGGLYDETYEDLIYCGTDVNEVLYLIQSSVRFGDKYSESKYIDITLWLDGKKVKNLQYDYSSYEDAQKAIEKFKKGING